MTSMAMTVAGACSLFIVLVSATLRMYCIRYYANFGYIGNTLGIAAKLPGRCSSSNS